MGRPVGCQDKNSGLRLRRFVFSYQEELGFSVYVSNTELII